MTDSRTLIRKLQWSYTKNRPELQALARRLYPEFVFARRPPELVSEIPVFNFHDVQPGDFEEKMRYLAGNGYRTADSQEFFEVLTRARPPAPRTVLLTFDDGWRSLHTVAAPILRERGMRAVAFLIPGLMWETRRETGDYPGGDDLVTWEECRQDRDVFDFQSHSMGHARVFVSRKLVDFIRPDFDFYALRLHVPVFQVQGRDNFVRNAAYGTPLYESAPRLAGQSRFLDDEAVRNACTDYVMQNGGSNFFSRPDWRKRLNAVWRSAGGSTGGRFEPEVEMMSALRSELAGSRDAIQRELPGVRVQAICYPWFVGSERATAVAKEAGYTAGFWGVLPKRRTNRPGEDPLRAVRMPPDYVMRLPGSDRLPLARVLKNMFTKNAPAFLRSLRSSRPASSTKSGAPR